MYIINDEKLKKSYQLKMYKMKKEVRRQFFNSSLKRRIIKPFLKLKITRTILRKIVPYTYEKIQKNTNYFSDSRIAIYTAIYGEYDKVYNPKFVPDNCDFYIFTDKEIDNKSNVWKQRKVDLKNFEKFTNPEKNRFLKMHPHLFFSEYDYSIYIDGNIEVVTDFTEFIQDFNKYGIKLHNHFSRNCIYDEIDECISQHKISTNQLILYKEKLIEENFPKNYGLLEAPIICRQHNNNKCIKIMDLWWDEYYNNIRRDQIALIYVLYKNNIKPEILNGLGIDIHSNYSFIQHSHNKKNI